jgi:hypothetical protein
MMICRPICSRVCEFAGGSENETSYFVPVGQCHELVEDFLQSLKPTLIIPCCAEFILPALQVESVRFTDFRYFVS